MYRSELQQRIWDFISDFEGLLNRLRASNLAISSCTLAWREF